MTATTPRPADAIDIATIRATCERVLWSPSRFSTEETERLNSLVLGHIQLLVPELSSVTSHLSADDQDVAAHVLAETERRLQLPRNTPTYLWDMAVQCRAIVTLYDWAKCAPEPSPV
ncbi:DUF6415 family natural product biosynthesis protein [Streptomyces fuscichromogenes]|uniref:Uncharacterized protein n=1 Tax=Streptomyces fuscichromogenes TaxID=1324013 RepID=A0A917XMZ5_9ACTN|nr:DUF6415 family natural product biosynthesis protein [Streptomyces fuscichromogenes]GGN40953.1 hypothetical protein GCM10011578_088750 [Streptomyces fuscichromogenes]